MIISRYGSNHTEDTNIQKINLNPYDEASKFACLMNHSVAQVCRRMVLHEETLNSITDRTSITQWYTTDKNGEVMRQRFGCNEVGDPLTRQILVFLQKGKIQTLISKYWQKETKRVVCVTTRILEIDKSTKDIC